MFKFSKLGSLAAVVLVAGAVGCGETKSDSDAGEVNKGPADVLAFPDGFRNVAHKCDGHGHRVFSASRGDTAGAAVAVIEDSTCKR
jgi:hypothetical protein